MLLSLYLGVFAPLEMRRAAWTLLCLGLLGTDNVFCQICTTPVQGECQCAAGGFNDTRVLNPPGVQRSYSSFIPGHINSLLDDLKISDAWASNNVASGEWMQIDAGASMYIVGVITQGRGPAAPGQFVSRFSVQHRETAGGSLVTMLGSFSQTNGLKREHLFDTPIKARYVRFVVATWYRAPWQLELGAIL